MKIIGLISDTHGFIHSRIFDFFESCHEIWHAGDIGSIETFDKLSAFKPLRAVFGNIDDYKMRQICPETQLFYCENVKVMITHIGGYPGKYANGITLKLKQHKPNLFVSGHSHILKVMPDTKNNLLFINPGAAGNYGIHQKITFVKFKIDASNIHDLEIMEIDRHAVLP